MTYVVRSDHIETLVSGRAVARGEEISNAEAQKNPRLIERGVLVERPTKPKSKPAPKPPVKPVEETPASAPENEEESK